MLQGHEPSDLVEEHLLPRWNTGWLHHTDHDGHDGLGVVQDFD